MPVIESSIKITCDEEKAYTFVKDNFERFPRFIKNIKELKLLQKLSLNKIITAWVVDIGGASVRWQEEDIFNDKDFSISFRMIEGDYAKYEGRWSFENLSGGTKIYISAIFDWGIPNLGKHVGPILERKAELYFRSMLLAIKKALSAGVGIK